MVGRYYGSAQRQIEWIVEANDLYSKSHAAGPWGRTIRSEARGRRLLSPGGNSAFRPREKGPPVLRDDINNALKEAMKARNERAVSTLRMVNAALKNADIEARGAGKPPLGDTELLPLLQKMIKQRQESVELYQKGNRADLVKQEQEEIAIISGYLPKQMSEAEMTAAIETAIKDTGAAGMKDMGKVIGALRAKYAGQMDMAKASGMVKAKLAG